jgi:hypothetical protein
MERIIFLDVDGVLNNGSWAMEMYDKGIRTYRDDILPDETRTLVFEIEIKNGSALINAVGRRSDKTSATE